MGSIPNSREPLGLVQAAREELSQAAVMSAVRENGDAAHASTVYWACQLFGWGINAAAQVFSVAASVQQPLSRIVLEVVLLNALALVCSHLLRQYIKRHDWGTLGIKALLPRMLVASVALGVPFAIIMNFMAIEPMWRLNEAELPALTDDGLWLGQIDPLLLRSSNWSALFFLWGMIYFCLTSLRDRHSARLRQSELIRALQLAELRVLKSQLNPHFLFNSLNSVRALITDDPAGAQKAVTQLARTLRYTLSAGQDDLVTLERELEIVADYLQLESLRLGSRLRIEQEVDAKARSMRIPVMLLQTVVENAVKHGIAELPQGGVLRIQVACRDDTLHIEVQNPRPRTVAVRASEGVGLRNAAERLRLLFGAGATLDLDLSTAEHASTRIHVPQTP
jgi:hypothetical protein